MRLGTRAPSTRAPSTRANPRPVNPRPVNTSPEFAAALDALRHRAGTVELALAAAPTPLTGGFWAEMWILDLTATNGALPDRVVLRLAPNAEHARWETTVQRAVAEQGFPTPSILAAGAASETVGPWSVMQLATGHPLMAGLSGAGAIAKLPHLARALPRQLATAAAQLHALDPGPVRDALTAATGQPVGLDGLIEHLGARLTTIGAVALGAHLDALVSTRPSPGPEVVCHGDLHPFNVLTDGGRLTVLDWTAAQIAEREYDLSFTSLLVSSPPLSVPGPVRPAINGAARWLARRFLTEYARCAPSHAVDEARLAWYHRLHTIRILMEVAEWEAVDPLDDHRGHPWLIMRASLEDDLPR